MTVWMTADTHFSHANIIKHCNRPFKSSWEMDNVLLENINDLVDTKDTFYILGDFSFKAPSWKLEEYRRRIQCKEVHLILGNHDKESQLKPLFSTTSNLKTIYIDKQPIVLCHYAMRTWYRSHWGSYQLAGHSHGGLKEILPDNKEGLLSLDVGVDVWDYKPVCYEQVVEVMNKKNWKPIRG